MPKFEPPDPRKNAENKRKHGITLYEARKAFDDPGGFLKVDEKHSIEEPRFFWYGKIKGKVCLVRFTIRSGKIRIFGAGFWRKETKIYENFHEEKGTY
jgi:uncharacterized DUF497 family protein